ncbi:hypothetical protein [Sulfitobacter geojensis]|uniref:Uncharacterized protein n=1 Tax=Sulfitobacter geojensis TaxID=1342299 RepID=A0AAE2VVN0_9RHOB|nr:hypothetical protein [Sulfitobacter geojensis]KHA52607.1 hypothetical protein Z947_2916 [Sulfitobacter geojensis]MBM1688042.1 hypothetical protein [Sulfitobacter geojensis]MBM1692109.1 hypothetical protein [Sulfitobacter geojensis]MBM1704275.1 hypothetical protein [Sulfitobacter geojensis]MBM1708333.1 hypothetical protein [Sulfitobacter geojensis]
MNQIINMIIRQVMHQLVRRGVSAGFDKASEIGQRRKGQGRNAQQLPPDALDDYGNPIAPQLTPEERRQQRHARQQARQAKQAMKVMRRVK